MQRQPHPRALSVLALMIAWPIGCDKTVEVDPGDLSERVSDISATIHDDHGSIVVVSWQQLEANEGWVEYSADGSTWMRSPERALEEGAQDQLLLGVPYGADVSLQLVQTGETGTATSDAVTISTDKLPGGIPKGELMSADPARYDADRPYLLAGVYDWTVIIDRQGEVVWAAETPLMRSTLQPQPSADGTEILVDHGSFWALFDGGERSTVQRMAIDGTVIATHDTAGLHHPFNELPDGSIVWAAMGGDDETLERLTPDGRQETIASCRELLGGDYDGKGYCGSNTIRTSPDGGSLLWSLYSHDTVLEVDLDTGQALRQFGHHPGSWAFDPPSSAFWWQHGAYYTDDGTLLVSSYVADEDDELVVREYELDDANQTLRQVWSFRGSEAVHGETMGEAWRLPGGNTLHNYGEGQRIREVTPDGAVVWDLDFSGGGLVWELGRSTPVEDLYDFMP